MSGTAFAITFAIGISIFLTYLIWGAVVLPFPLNAFLAMFTITILGFCAFCILKGGKRLG